MVVLKFFLLLKVGCKKDIAESETNAREVSEKEAKEFAAHHKISSFETSAKTGKNVEEAFASLSQTVYDKIQVNIDNSKQNWIKS